MRSRAAPNDVVDARAAARAIAKARRRIAADRSERQRREPRCFSMLVLPATASEAATTDAGAASVMLLGELASHAAAERRDARRARETVPQRMKRTLQAAAAVRRLGGRARDPRPGSCSVSSSSARTCACSCPSPTTPEQRLLLDEIGEGPASRVLVIALRGRDARRARRRFARAHSRRCKAMRTSASSPTARCRSTRFPKSCCRIVICCRRRSTRDRFDADYLQRGTRSARTRSCIARRRVSRAVAAARSDARAAEGLRALAADAGAAASVRRLVRRGRAACAAASRKPRRRRSIPTGSACALESLQQAFTPIDRRRQADA